MTDPKGTPADPLREALAEWKFEKAADQTFETYLVQAPSGYTAAVSALDRNPANVLFLLAKAMVRVLATKLAETPGRISLTGFDVQPNKSVHPTESAGKSPEAVDDERAERAFIQGRVSEYHRVLEILERARHESDMREWRRAISYVWEEVRDGSVIDDADALAETQRSSNATRSDEQEAEADYIGDRERAEGTDEMAAGDRWPRRDYYAESGVGAVQPPAPEPLADALREAAQRVLQLSIYESDAEDAPTFAKDIELLARAALGKSPTKAGDDADPVARALALLSEYIKDHAQEGVRAHHFEIVERARPGDDLRRFADHWIARLAGKTNEEWDVEVANMVSELAAVRAGVQPADSIEAIARDNTFDLAKATPAIRREHDEALAAAKKADDAAAPSASQPREDKTP